MTERDLLNEVFQICLKYATDSSVPIEDTLKTVGEALIKFTEYLEYIEKN